MAVVQTITKEQADALVTKPKAAADVTNEDYVVISASDLFNLVGSSYVLGAMKPMNVPNIPEKRKNNC